MKIVRFTLQGELALWRNVYDSIGSYSCLGPAPSALAGLCGAALGFASPRSLGAVDPDPGRLKVQWQAGFPWPAAPQLLEWLKINEVFFACRWTGGFPRRIAWNVNGRKEINGSENLRMQQQVIEAPCYEAAVRLARLEDAEKLAEALKVPAFRLYLGCSECPAFVTDISLVDVLPRSGDWAFRSEQGALGEATPFSVMRLDAERSLERLKIMGYWIYPTPGMPGKMLDDPFVRGYEE